MVLEVKGKVNIKKRRKIGFLDLVLGVSSALVFMLAFFLAYFLPEISLLSLFAYAMPIYLIYLSALLLLALICRKWKYALMIGVFFLCLQKPIAETIHLGGGPHIADFDSNKTLSVMSFNVSTFNTKRYEVLDSTKCFDDSVFLNQFRVLLKTTGKDIDVICFQEFHHHEWEIYSMINFLGVEAGFSYYYMKPFINKNQKGLFGMIIFSRYPIINQKSVDLVKSESFNKIMYVDILKDKDTVRVVNAHLHSMSIRLDKTDTATIATNTVNIYHKLLTGSDMRAPQAKMLVSLIDSTRYPILVCGDFNTFPYSHSYQLIKTRLDNAFENAGHGFGFSLNIFPYYVRLDNQFYSKEFKALDFRVYKHLNGSDHFPIIADYYLDNGK